MMFEGEYHLADLSYLVRESICTLSLSRERAEANANYDDTERKMKREHDRGTHREFAASQVHEYLIIII